MGFKRFVFCDARNGYAYRMQNTGKKIVETINSTGLCTHVLDYLFESLEHKNIRVYFYSNPNLIFTLAGKGIDACVPKHFPK